jgi:hypothetical protein
MIEVRRVRGSRGRWLQTAAAVGPHIGVVWPGIEADTELAALGALARTDSQRAQAVISRVASLAFTLGRPTEAETVLDTAANATSDDAAAQELAGMRSVLEAFLGRTVQAAQTAAGYSLIRGVPLLRPIW